jgi:hypothetical protein
MHKETIPLQRFEVCFPFRIYPTISAISPEVQPILRKDSSECFSAFFFTKCGVLLNQARTPLKIALPVLMLAVVLRALLVEVLYGQHILVFQTTVAVVTGQQTGLLQAEQP